MAVVVRVLAVLAYAVAAYGVTLVVTSAPGPYTYGFAAFIAIFIVDGIIRIAKM